MDFGFIDESADLHGVRLRAVTLREEANAREPERKRLMKEARLAGDDETHELMSKVRPPAWYAIVDCEACPQQSLISAHTPAASRFACTACKRPASLSWVEEHAREKVEKMYDAYAEKKAKEEQREIHAWERKAVTAHRHSVRKEGCRITKAGRFCDWCELVLPVK